MCADRNLDSLVAGYNNLGQLGDGSKTASLVPVTVLGGHTFAQVACGGYFSCGVTQAGALLCWGEWWAAVVQPCKRWRQCSAWVNACLVAATGPCILR